MAAQFAQSLYPDFNIEKALSRSIGLITHDELRLLQGKRVAIAGLGGVGGSHLLTLTRLGIGNFHIADFDHFEVHNFNRQAGANLSTLGQAKTTVLTNQARLINPNLNIKVFPDGVTSTNISEFIKHVDVYVDGLDFFAFSIRQLVFEHCYRNNIPIVTAGPIAIGGALLVFMPGGMSPASYFNWKNTDNDKEKALKFLIGLTPSLPQRNQIVDPTAVNFNEHRGPSLPMSCELCAGIAGTEVLKILTGRGRIYAAPHSLHFDAFSNRLHHRWIWGGNKNPLQRLKIFLGLRRFK